MSTMNCMQFTSKHILFIVMKVQIEVCAYDIIYYTILESIVFGKNFQIFTKNKK